MNKYFVLYMAPIEGLEAWQKLPESERKAEEEKMMSEWNAWMASHKNMIAETAGLGSTKRVTKAGVTDTKNNLMLYAFVNAESHQAAADLFKDHPHFGIPEATIEVMEITPLSQK